MLTTLLALSLTCKPMPPPVLATVPPPMTTRCEGPDLVTRDHDHREVSRRFNGCISSACEGPDLVSRDSARVEYGRARFSASCVVSRCEGGDLVRRDMRGVVFSRVSLAPSCLVTSCEGNDWVTRDHRGLEVRRQVFRCGPPVRPAQTDAWRFGLTAK